MTCRRTGSILGLILVLVTGAWVWQSQASSPILATRDLGAWIATLTLSPADGRAYALSQADGRVFVLNMHTGALTGVLRTPLPTRVLPNPTTLSAPQIVDGQVVMVGARPQ